MTAPDDIAGLVERGREVATRIGARAMGVGSQLKPLVSIPVQAGDADLVVAELCAALAALSEDNKRLRDRVRQLAALANTGDTPAARAERDAVRKSEGPFDDF